MIESLLILNEGKLKKNVCNLHENQLQLESNLDITFK